MNVFLCVSLICVRNVCVVYVFKVSLIIQYVLNMSVCVLCVRQSGVCVCVFVCVMSGVCVCVCMYQSV